MGIVGRSYPICYRCRHDTARSTVNRSQQAVSEQFQCRYANTKYQNNGYYLHMGNCVQNRTVVYEQIPDARSAGLRCDDTLRIYRTDKRLYRTAGYQLSRYSICSFRCVYRFWRNLCYNANIICHKGCWMRHVFLRKGTPDNDQLYPFLLSAICILDKKCVLKTALGIYNNISFSYVLYIIFNKKKKILAFRGNLRYTVSRNE